MLKDKKFEDHEAMKAFPLASRTFIANNDENPL